MLRRFAAVSRRALVARSTVCFSRNMAAAAAPAVDFDALRADLKKMYDEVPCQPIMVRLAWHDAGEYCDKTKTGGANASIRFEEMGHAANAGLKWAEEKLEPFKTKYEGISYADLYQFASYVAIEHAGGPTIEFKAGRKDATKEDCPPEGRLPDATKKAAHLRDVFYRMGFNDGEIVALSGAHTLGRCHKDRSGFEGAWTAEPNKFDNTYFKNLLAPADGLLVLPTDAAMVEDEKMKPFVEKYAADQEAFFADYAAAHKKLSELGAF